ncbi:Zinc finger, CCHC-type, partial [Cinara cedri]
MGNETLAKLKKNVRKYEMVEFMITGDTPKTPFDIETEMIQSKAQQINKDNSSKKPEIDRLREEVENLKLLINSGNPKQNYVDNKYNNSSPNFNEHSRQNNYNQPWYGQPSKPHFDNNYQPNNINRYSQPSHPENPTRNQRYANNDPPNKYKFSNQTKSCSFCSKKGHYEEECYQKNKPPTISCQICNKPGHTA